MSCKVLRVAGLLAVVAAVFAATASADTISSITSNFNGTAVSSGSYLWFSAVGKINSGYTSPFTFFMTSSKITFTSTDSSHKSITVNTPNAKINIGPSGTVGSDSFDVGTNTWTINAAYNQSGNILFDAAAYLIPSGIGIKGANPVTWTASFSSTDPNVKINWSWAAAAYSGACTAMGSNTDDSHYGSLGVKAVDTSIHAGTPTNCANLATSSYLEPGARGGGGSNWTGSLSGTASFTPTKYTPPKTPEPSSLILVLSGIGSMLAFRRK